MFKTFLLAMIVVFPAFAAAQPSDDAKPVPDSFQGRRGPFLPEKALREGAGKYYSLSTLAWGLKWLAVHQSADGRWKLDGDFPDKGNANDVAGTALGLLPFLGVGKTHKADRDNPYVKAIDKCLTYLLTIQMRDLIVASQDKDADDKSRWGSWNPKGDAWGAHGGRLMDTSLNLLTLETRYRHVPLFRDP